MADCTFGGSAIFGTFNRLDGPVRQYRAMRSQLPTVDGVRVYRIGKDVKVWSVRGRIIVGSVVNAISAVQTGIALQDGQPRVFVDTGGLAHANCILNDFRPIGPYTAINLSSGAYAVTVVIRATIEQLSPDT